MTPPLARQQEKADFPPWDDLLCGLCADWRKVLRPALALADDKAGLHAFLSAEAAGTGFYPAIENLFTAFRLTPFARVRVVILGQDPYHGEGQAHGLAFSVPRGIKKLPPSLKNIYREIGSTPPAHGDLSHWAEQGVLLLNTALSVRPGAAASHQGRGWEIVTDAVIQALNTTQNPLFFLLWGSHAQGKSGLIDEPRHTCLSAPHPSPLSAYRGFFGCGHFDAVNHSLTQRGEPPIRWQAPL